MERSATEIAPTTKGRMATTTSSSMSEKPISRSRPSGRRRAAVPLPGAFLRTFTSADVNLVVDAVHGRHQCHGNETDDEAHEHDDRRLEQAREALEPDVHLAVV